MSTKTQIPSLANLGYIPYLDENGHLWEKIQGKIGVYAIFDQSQKLQFVGYSRDIYLSLKQHLIRQPEKCYWFKFQTINRPSRTILEEIRQAWLAENGEIPLGNGEDEEIWTQPIDAKKTMTATEKNEYRQLEEIGQIKFLKKISRRLEETINQQLNARGLKMEIRFNPKLKEQGLLDLK